MSLGAHDQRALDSIEEKLADSAPGLASRLAMFAQLTAGEELPAREQICVSLLQEARPARARRLRSRPEVPCPACGLRCWPGWRLALLWLAVSAVLVAGALLASRGGGCAARSAACAGRPPARARGPAVPVTPSGWAPGGAAQEDGYRGHVERIPVLSTAPGHSAQERPAVILRPALVPVTRVVVGVDGSAGSVAALHWAAAAAVRWQAGLRIVSAWEEAGQGGSFPAGSSAQAAARIVQTALARVLSRQHYPRRIACAAMRGAPGDALLSQALDTGLLVLGTARAGADRRPGATGRYCLQHGSGPLVLVPSDDASWLPVAP